MTREEFEIEYEKECIEFDWEKIDVLESERLILRPFVENDADDLLEMVSDVDTAYWAGMEPLTTAQQIHEFIDTGNIMACEPQFGIVLKSTGKVIGAIGYFWDSFSTCGDTCVGYFLSAAYRGNGYMTEALKTVSDHFFKVTGSYRLKCEIRPDNLPSRRVAQKCGFVQNPDQTRWRLNCYDKPLDEFFLYSPALPMLDTDNLVESDDCLSDGSVHADNDIIV